MGTNVCERHSQLPTQAERLGTCGRRRRVEDSTSRRANSGRSMPAKRKRAFPQRERRRLWSACFIVPIASMTTCGRQQHRWDLRVRRAVSPIEPAERNTRLEQARLSAGARIVHRGRLARSLALAMRRLLRLLRGAVLLTLIPVLRAWVARAGWGSRSPLDDILMVLGVRVQRPLREQRERVLERLPLRRRLRHSARRPLPHARSACRTTDSGVSRSTACEGRRPATCDPIPRVQRGRYPRGRRGWTVRRALPAARLLEETRVPG